MEVIHIEPADVLAVRVNGRIVCDKVEDPGDVMDALSGEVPGVEFSWTSLEKVPKDSVYWDQFEDEPDLRD